MVLGFIFSPLPKLLYSSCSFLPCSFDELAFAILSMSEIEISISIA